MNAPRGERPAARRLLQAAALLLTCSLAARGIAQQGIPAERIANFAPSRAAGISSDARRELERLPWFAEHGQHREAAAAALDLAATPRTGWIAVGDGSYRGWSTAVAALVLSLPEESQAAYREAAEPLARRRLMQALRERDDAMLQGVIDEFPGVPASIEAQWLAGDWALERGEWRTAQADWRMVEVQLAGLAGPASPATEHALAAKGITDRAAQSRGVLALIRGGELVAAAEQLARLRTDEEQASAPRSAADQQTGEAAASTWSVKRLEQELKAASGWAAPPAPDRDWREFAGDALRGNHAGGEFAANAATWSVAWSASLVDPAQEQADRAEDRELRHLARLNIATPPPVFPAVVGDVLAWQDERGVQLRRLATGESLTGVDAPAYAWQHVAPPRLARPMPTLRQPQFTVTMAHGAVWAARPQAVATVAPRRGAAELVAIDADPSARLRLRVRLDELVHDQGGLAGAVFASPLLVERGVVAAVVCTPGDAWKLQLVGFDAEDGRLLWRTPLGTGGTPAMNQALEYPLAGIAAVEGIVVASTNLGMIAAVRIADGTPLWLQTYERKLVRDMYGGFRYYNALPEMPLTAGRCVVAAPRDAERVFAWDLFTGALMWSSPLPDANARVFAVNKSRLILASERPWSVRLRDGRVDDLWGDNLWAGAGQGSLRGRTLLWPTAAGVKIVSATTCDDVGETLGLPDGPANVVAVGEFLVAAGRQRITVFRREDATKKEEARESRE